jgi:hypothetical protein
VTALVDLYKTDHKALVAWVVKTYGLSADHAAFNVHRLRRETIGQRLRLYRDDGRLDFERIIELVFETEEVQRQRKKMIAVATEQNVTRRIVDEVASLYDRPAVRTLPDAAANIRFHAEAAAVELDEVMQEKQRLTFLCNEVMIWRAAPIEPGAPSKLHIVTPDCFDAIPHPKDQLELAGVLIDKAPSTILDGDQRARLPHFELWDDTYRYLISGTGVLVDENGDMATEPRKHELGRLPGVLLHRRKPVDRLLDARAGRDITAAHLAVGLLSIMIMRLAKSQGERQPVLSGNLANVAGGQSMDGEKPLVLPPEVVASMLETRTDPSHYLDAKKDKLVSVAQTYGMSYEQMNYQEGAEAASGRSYQLRREKLIELRNEQRRRSMLDERLIVDLMGYSIEGIKIDHSEQAMPQDAMEEIQLLDAKMRLGLDSPVKYVMRKDPDLTRDDATSEITKNLRDYAALIVQVRALNLPAKADASNPGQDPTLNGAMGGKQALASGDPAADEAAASSSSSSSSPPANP